MISQMASSNDFFLNTCNTMFERMINTVPRDVQLTDVIKPLQIKPRKLSVAVNDDKTLSITGFIRVSAALPPVAVDADLELLTTSLILLKVVDDLISANGTQVIIHLASRSGEALPVAIGTTSRGLTAGCGYPNCGPSYTYYRFNSTIPVEQGISSFTVEIIDGSTGRATVYNNGGGGFPVSDAILPMFSLSSQSLITIDGSDQLQLNLTAAVSIIHDSCRNLFSFNLPSDNDQVLNAEMYTNISLIVPQPSNKSAPISPWIQERVLMEPSGKISGTNFTLYRGTWQSSGPLTATSSHPFDLVAQGPTKTVSSLFNSWDDVEFI